MNLFAGCRGDNLHKPDGLLGTDGVRVEVTFSFNYGHDEVRRQAVFVGVAVGKGAVMSALPVFVKACEFPRCFMAEY